MAEGVSAGRGASAGRVVQQESNSAVRINDHLSHCRPEKCAWLAATTLNLLYQRTGVTGPLVMFSLVPYSSSAAALVLVLPYQFFSLHRARNAQELL
jgi:hypothetical protein